MVPYSDISAQVQSLNHSILLSIILCNLLILVCLLSEYRWPSRPR
ncbi:MAG: hypothetical protein ACLTW9_01170 [Enterocloster sp.]